MLNIKTWLDNPAVKNKIVFAKDKVGQMLRTERELSNIAIKSLKIVL